MSFSGSAIRQFCIETVFFFGPQFLFFFLLHLIVSIPSRETGGLQSAWQVVSFPPPSSSAPESEIVLPATAGLAFVSPGALSLSRWPFWRGGRGLEGRGHSGERPISLSPERVERSKLMGVASEKGAPNKAGVKSIGLSASFFRSPPLEKKIFRACGVIGLSYCFPSLISLFFSTTFVLCIAFLMQIPCGPLFAAVCSRSLLFILVHF